MKRLPSLSVLECLGLTVWTVLFNVIGSQTWRHGRQTFVLLLVAVVFMLAMPALSHLRLPHWITRTHRPLGALVAVAALAMAVNLVWGLGEALNSRPGMTDIPRNTWQAGSVLLEGKNPYATRCQLWVEFEQGPHVQQTREGVNLHGVPYRYGFPYFPVMMLSYLPARLLGLGQEGIRVWNLVITMASLLGLVLLVRRLTPRRPATAWVAAAAFLAVKVYAEEIFSHAVVDIIIAALAVFAMLALTHQRWLLAGILLGLAQGCKLLPAPILVLAVLVWIWGRPGWRAFIGGYLTTAGIVIIPFILAGPEEFFSATVLFYLVHHAQGDTTALYPYLPPAWRLPHQIVGFLATMAVVAIPVRWRQEPAWAPMLAGFTAYLVFIAFGRMSHLNYLWSVWPLGCGALAVLLARATERSTP